MNYNGWFAIKPNQTKAKFELTKFTQKSMTKHIQTSLQGRYFDDEKFRQKT